MLIRVDKVTRERKIIPCCFLDLLSYPLNQDFIGSTWKWAFFETSNKSRDTERMKTIAFSKIFYFF